MNSIGHLWRAIGQNFLIRIFLDLLRIKVVPFCLFIEESAAEILPRFDNKSGAYEAGFLGPADMKVIANIPDRDISEKELIKRLKIGNFCYGIKFHGEIIGFIWYDLFRCQFEQYIFSLRHNEAYIFDTYTLAPFRRKGIASYIRYRLYKELISMDKTRFYSIAEYFNVPSIKFKEKWGAKILRLILYVELFEKLHISLTLRNYLPNDCNYNSK
jgi:GNAT superfamily N-acetyltransferase